MLGLVICRRRMVLDEHLALRRWLGGLGAALGPLAGGIVYNQLGKEFLFYFAALSVLPAFLLVMISRRAKK